MTKSIAVLGLGRYGMSFAKSMYAMGADVLAVDQDEDKIRDFAGSCTAAVSADISNEEEVLALGLKNMDIVVTAMSRNLGASIIAVSVAKDLGVPLVVAKSSSDRMSSILKKVGADKVIVPEDEGGMRSARILSSDLLLDYFKVDGNLSLAEIKPQNAWLGKNLIDLDLRRKYKMNVVAMKKEGNSWAFADPFKKLEQDDSLLVAAEGSGLADFIKLE